MSTSAPPLPHQAQPEDSPDTSSTSTTATLLPSPTPTRNNLAYVLLSLSVYYQENFFVGSLPRLVPETVVGLSISFVFLPAFLLKTFLAPSLSSLPSLTVNRRLLLSALLFLLASLSSLSTLSADPADNKWGAALTCALVSLGMGLGEISCLENASVYQRKCSISWSVGHGVSGLLVALLLKFIQALPVRRQMLFSLPPSLLLPLAQFVVLGAPKVLLPHSRSHSKSTKEGKKEGRKEYGLWETLRLTFTGEFAGYTWALFLDYFFYMLVWCGIVPTLKDKIADKSLVAKAFIGVKFVAFLCKFAPYLLKFERVLALPVMHLAAGALLVREALREGEKSAAVVIAGSVAVGATHGLASAYGITCIRENVKERWVKFALKNVTNANSLGALLGCWASIGSAVLLKAISR